MKNTRHLLSIADLTPEGFWKLVESARELKAHPTLKNKRTPSQQRVAPILRYLAVVQDLR